MRWFVWLWFFLHSLYQSTASIDCQLQCSNGGTCVFDADSSGASCRCSAGFTGTNCELVLCHSSCMNGGICVADGEDRYCSCAAGFIGPFCSDRIDCSTDAECEGNQACKERDGGGKYCSCDADKTGFFCELTVTPYTLPDFADGLLLYYWSFNVIPFGRRFVDKIKHKHLTRYGDARIAKSAELGNVATMNRLGRGKLISAPLTNPCLAAPDSCPDGVSVSFWLQFISGGIIVRTGRAGFRIYVKQEKYFITFRNLTHVWKIERGCMPMGVFHVTATWSGSSGLAYYENGQAVASTSSSGVMSEPVATDRLTVGYEETSVRREKYSSLIIDDLAIWKRSINSTEAQEFYKYGLSTNLGRSSCLARPCASGFSCIQSNDSKVHSCVERSSQQCTFDDGLCDWKASNSTTHELIYSTTNLGIKENIPYYDHTVDNCSDIPGSFLLFKNMSGLAEYRLSSDYFISTTGQGHLFRLQFWYFMYGGNSGELQVDIEQSTGQVGNETLLSVWKSEATREKIWKFAEVVMKSDHRFRAILRATVTESNEVIALDDLGITACDPYVAPLVTSVKFDQMLTGSQYNFQVNVTWATSGCSENFSYASIVYTRESNQTWVPVATTTSVANQVAVNSTLFVIGARYEFKVKLRYIINNEKFVSQDSPTYSRIVPDTFMSSSLTFETDPPSEETPLGHAVDRGSRVAITCTISSTSKPSLVWKKSTFGRTSQLLPHYAVPTAVTNVWTRTISISPFGDSHCATYICEASVNDKTIYRSLTITVRGYYNALGSFSSSSLLLSSYKSTYRFWMYGVGSSVPGADFEILDWQTEQWISSEANKVVRAYLIYWAVTADYLSMQCSFTGYHRFVYTRNTTRTFRLFSSMLQISNPDPPQDVKAAHEGTNRARVSWTSPHCNGGPVRSVRVTLYVGGNSTATKIFETNQTNWENKTYAGFVVIDDYAFLLNVQYYWQVAVLYDYRNGRVWSQGSAKYLSRISNSLFTTLSFQSSSFSGKSKFSEKYGYFVELGTTALLTCFVNSVIQPQITWNLLSYRGYQTVDVPRFPVSGYSSTGYGWTSTLQIESFNHSFSGNYSCNSTYGDLTEEQHVTLFLFGSLNLIEWHASPGSFLVQYNSTFDIYAILQGYPVYNVDLEVLDWRSHTWSSVTRAYKAILIENGYIKPYARYSTIQCFGSGYHRLVAEREDYSQLIFRFPNPIQLSDSDPPTNIRAVFVEANRVHVLWNSPGCNGGPMRSVRVLIMASGYNNYSKIVEANQTKWDSETGEGSVLIEDYQFTTGVEYFWQVSVEYDYSGARTWSQQSSVYRLEYSDQLVLSLTFNSSLNDTTLSQVGFLITRGARVELTCTIKSSAKPNVLWALNRLGLISKNGSEPVLTTDDIWTSKLIVENFDYANAGIYYCRPNTGKQLVLSIQAPPIIAGSTGNFSTLPYGSNLTFNMYILGNPVSNVSIEMLATPSSEWKHVQTHSQLTPSSVFWVLPIRFPDLRCKDTPQYRLLITGTFTRHYLLAERRNIVLDPDSPVIVSVLRLTSSDVYVAWRAVPCNFGYPRGIRVSVYLSATRDPLVEVEFNMTIYNNATGVGSTIVHSERFVSGSSYIWVVRVLYNGDQAPVWSRPSQELRRSVADPQIIHLTYENISSDGDSLLTEHGYLVVPGETVLLTCRFLSASQPRFNWGVYTYSGFHPLNTSTSPEAELSLSSTATLWVSKLYIKDFNYSSSGNYSCSVTSGDTSGVKYVTLLLYGPAIVVDSRNFPASPLVTYGSTFTMTVTTAGAIVRPDIEIFDWRTQYWQQAASAVKSLVIVNGFGNAQARYQSMRCSFTGRHRLVLHRRSGTKDTYELPNIFVQLSDPDPPEKIVVLSTGIDRVRVSWVSPSCNGGPMRGARIVVYDSNNFTKMFETNQTKWNNATYEASAVISYHFAHNTTYSWKVAVQYDYNGGRTWSQYGVTHGINFGEMFNLTFVSNTSSSLASKSQVGYLIKKGEHVSLTCVAYSEDTLNVYWSVRTYKGDIALNRSSFTVEVHENQWYSVVLLRNYDYHHCGIYTCKVVVGDAWRELHLPLAIEAPITLQRVVMNLTNKARFGSLRSTTFMLLGYPRPQAFLERLGLPNGRWKNYTSFLPSYSQEVYWILKVDRHLACADTGQLRLVVIEANVRRVININERTPLIDPDPPRILSVEYLTQSRVNITWKASKCNFAHVRGIRIRQSGSGVSVPMDVSDVTTNWDNETEIGYQIVENVTLVSGESYQWNISVVYGEGEEQVVSQTSEIFQTVVIDVDECELNISLCHAYAVCSNTLVSYDCQCNSGFFGDGRNCTDIDECEVNTDNCGENAVCTNTNGSFVCSCKTGFTGDGLSCSDINECERNPCHSNATCTDTNGSYICQCKSGFSGDGFSCVNINECLKISCHPNATCVDSHGSYSCHCKPGFDGNGTICENVNECLSSPCDVNATCMDNIGSYNCRCHAGFSGNGTICTNENECMQNPCHFNATCNDTIGSYSCQCRDGFTGNGTNCTNINECEKSPCDSNATCTDTNGSYICQCKSGFSGDGFSCVNINECLKISCHPNATCVDSHGSYSCHCKPGFDGNGTICENVNECLSSPCDVNATCMDNIGSYNCRCHAGFSGNGTICTNENECMQNPCHSNATCTDTTGSYSCQCKDGFTGNGVSCADINECERNPCDSNATCTHTLGSYICQCKSGFSGDGFSCVNINECLKISCHPNATCVDSHGSYSCHCKPGFDGNGTICENVNECLSSPCDVNATCMDNIGSYNCRCHAGFSGNGTICTNENECMQNPCHFNATCTDTIGSYSCQCRDAFTGNGTNCTNINECERNPCDSNATCMDTLGSYICQCKSGFSGDGFVCVNINECLKISCHPNATCVDSHGSYSCHCKPGFDGNGTICENINECMQSPCHFNATCSDTIGSYSCQCKDGFTGDGMNCTNVNECAESTCHFNATCSDTIGSYSCQCKDGFTGDGMNCTNINECEKSPCDSNATCTDTIGSYICQCKSGFSGDGFSCVNINECLKISCHPNATCVDSHGSYSCHCKPGFDGNGTICENVNECLSSPCDVNATCMDNIGSYNCSCHAGYSGNGTICTNINECEISPCHPNATCTDTIGNYICQCKPGFSGDGVSCTNVNECAESPCHFNATCTDTVGSYSCQCKVAFSGDGTNCTNVNECAESPCHFNATCTDTIGSYSCQCKVGFTGDGMNCTNVNECAESPCHSNATCSDTIGSYSCQCKDGFTGDGMNCTNVNECAGTPCHSNASCTDTIGSYSCQCKVGFTGNGMNCTNVNECAGTPCHSNASCTDTIGSYSCQCKVGFTGNGMNCTNVNECAGTPCHSNASCTDTIGSYSCQCKVGFTGNGMNCTNVNECAGTPCHSNASCTDTIGSYSCQCKDGFTGNGMSCSNINECENSPCHSNATCTDTIGSYICQCKPGFSGDVSNCSNVDECGQVNVCHADASCTDTRGAYLCFCNEGYTGDGKSCADIDECQRSGVCGTGGICSNNRGTYNCSCTQGYTGNSTFCQDIDECETVSICPTNSQCVNSVGTYSCTCNVGYSGSSGANCQILPDEFIDVTFGLEGFSFSNDLNSRESVGYKTLEGKVENNFDAQFSGHPEYRGTQVVRFSLGSVLCDVQVALAPVSPTNIIAVLQLANSTGKIGNLSVTRGSFESKDLPDLSDIKMIVNYNGFAGDLLEITCTVSGPSLPTFEWKNASETLSFSSRVKTETNDKVSKLSVRKTSKSDAGDYHCVARKGADAINATVNIAVKVIPVVSVSPLFVSVTEGDPITLTCDVSVGDGPNIQITWHSSKRGDIIGNNKKLNLNNIRVLASESLYTAEYWCLAKNSGGSGRSQNVTVVVRSKDLSDIKMIVNYNGFAGDLLEITCNVSGPSLPTFEWKKASETLSFSSRVKTETKDKVSKLSVRKTSKSDAGDYHCVARKGADSINATVNIAVKVIPVVSVSPLFVSVAEGDPITLTCDVSVGDEPNIQITWHSSKRGDISTNKKLNLNDIRVLASESLYTAEYWCLAKNSGGSGRSQNVTVVVRSKDFNEFCFMDEDTGYTWEKTAVHTIVIKTCPPDKTGTVSRLCNQVDGKPVWSEVNLSNCRSVVVIELKDKVDRLDRGFESVDIGNILKETADVTNDVELYEKDVEDVVYVLDKIKQKTETQDDRKNLIISSSNIVDNKKEKTWRKIKPKKKDQLVKTVVNAADLAAQEFVSNSPESSDLVVYSTPNIVIAGVRFPDTTTQQDPKPVDIFYDAVHVTVPADVVGELQQVTVVAYKKGLQDIFSQDTLESTVDDSLMSSSSTLALKSTFLSLTTEPKLNSSTSEPFKLVLQNNQTGYVDPKRICAFVEPGVSQSNWSTKGCTLNKEESNEVNVTCDCDHNTAFAILMDVSGVQLTETERKTLELISTIGCSISLIGITLTILMQVCFWKKVKSPRSKVLLSLCVAIGFTDIFAILEGVARDNSVFCTAVAALLHFFVLAAFGWMLCEGILLYILLIRVFDGVRGKHWKIFNVIGWGVPALIVAVSLAVTQADGYGTDTACWLSVESKLIWAFVGPAFFVILANTFVFIMVLRTMLNSHKIQQQDAIGKVRAGVKASVVIFPILGLTWVFGLMTFNRDTLFFRYLFAIFNSSQGMLIFLFHCVLNKQMRDIVRNSTLGRSTFSTSYGKKSVRRPPKDSLNSPSKTLGSNINQAIVDKNSRISNDWKSLSESRAYDNTVSQAEEMREIEASQKEVNDSRAGGVQNNTSGNELAGVSSRGESGRSGISVDRDPEKCDSASRGYVSGESENTSSEKPLRNDGEEFLTV